VKKKIFVICIDRDDDLGRKTKIRGPVIGKEKNLEAAKKLILADPSESDANTMFAAVSKLEEASKLYKNVEIVTITGQGKVGLQADKEINTQLDKLEKEYLIDGWIIITDGAEDEQVMPLLQSRAKIISTEKVTIKQAETVESTFYTIKEALKDPGVASLFLGVPGIVLIIYVAYDIFKINLWLGITSYQAIALIAGLYLLLKGFGIEEMITDYIETTKESLAQQKIMSFFFYTIAPIFPLVGLWLAYQRLMSSELIDITIDLISALRYAYPLFVAGIIAIIIGKANDSLHAKKAYQLGNYIVMGTATICLWAILDAGTLVFLKQAEIPWLTANIMLSLLIIVIVRRIGKIFDVRERTTKLFMGLNAMDEKGNYLGKITGVDKKKQAITIQEQGKKKIEKKIGEYKLEQGRIITTA
jgi:putative membrane protein